MREIFRFRFQNVFGKCATILNTRFFFYKHQQNFREPRCCLRFRPSQPKVLLKCCLHGSVVDQEIQSFPHHTFTAQSFLDPNMVEINSLAFPLCSYYYVVQSRCIYFILSRADRNVSIIIVLIKYSTNKFEPRIRMSLRVLLTCCLFFCQI